MFFLFTAWNEEREYFVFSIFCEWCMFTFGHNRFWTAPMTYLILQPVSKSKQFCRKYYIFATPRSFKILHIDNNHNNNIKIKRCRNLHSHLFILFIFFVFIFTEHVWEVQVHRRGLAVEKNIVGSYHLCLTDKALRLAQTGSKITLIGERRMPFVEFQLTTIRR